MCSEGSLTLATNNPLRLKRVNPGAKCLILSSGCRMPQSVGGGEGSHHCTWRCRRDSGCLLRERTG
jgi:hypothetical protein